MLTDEEQAERDREYRRERERIERTWKAHLLTRWLYGLADRLTVGPEELTRPGAWLDGAYNWIMCRLPWTREHRIRALFGSTVLFAAPDGHIHISWLQWEFAPGSQEHGGFTVTECKNWQELEPGALAHLAASGKTLAEGGLLPCPKPLADRARWGDYDAALAAPEGRK